LVFDPQRFGERVQVLLVGRVVLVLAVDLEARRRSRRQEQLAVAAVRLQRVDLALQLVVSFVRDRARADPVRPLPPDLLARRIEERAPLGRIAGELRELLAVLALQDQRDTIATRALREPAEAIVDVRQPVAALRVLAFVDDVEADLALLAHDFGDGGEAFRVGFEARGLGQAADVGRQDPFRAALHGGPPLTSCTAQCSRKIAGKARRGARTVVLAHSWPGSVIPILGAPRALSDTCAIPPPEGETMWRAGFSLSVLLALAGCAGMSEQACLVSDWRTIGFEDGASGRPVSTIGTYRQQCAKHGVAPDLESYRAGHDAGVESYCRPSRGFDVGRQGGTYHGVCPIELETDFLAAFHSGRRLFDLEASVREIDSRIAANVRAQERIKQELTQIAATIASDETSAEQRVELVARAAELGKRHGELTNENDVLADERVVAALELEDYRETLAYGF